MKEIFNDKTEKQKLEILFFNDTSIA